MGSTVTSRNPAVSRVPIRAKKGSVALACAASLSLGFACGFLHQQWPTPRVQMPRQRAFLQQPRSLPSAPVPLRHVAWQPWYGLDAIRTFLFLHSHVCWRQCRQIGEFGDKALTESGSPCHLPSPDLNNWMSRQIRDAVAINSPVWHDREAINGKDRKYGCDNDCKHCFCIKISNHGALCR